VLSSGDWVQAAAVAALGVAIHLVEANVLAPFIMEREVALPPVLTIAAVLVMGLLLGAVGLVVAVPVLAVTMVVLRHVVQGEFYGDPVASVAAPAPSEAGLPTRGAA
jgi:predicted PurR-regulated permease PerM